MRTAGRWNRRAVYGWLFIVIFPTLTCGNPPPHDRPALLYDKPGGFDAGTVGEADAWISTTLDGVIHVYRFRPFDGDFQNEFRHTLFRDRIAAAYREDKLLAQPVFKALAVTGAQSSIAAFFKNFNGGAPREHLRVAIRADGCVALVDVSANSPEAFERNWRNVLRLLNSLRVVEGREAWPASPSRSTS